MVYPPCSLRKWLLENLFHFMLALPFVHKTWEMGKRGAIDRWQGATFGQFLKLIWHEAAAVVAVFSSSSSPSSELFLCRPPRSPEKLGGGFCAFYVQPKVCKVKAFTGGWLVWRNF